MDAPSDVLEVAADSQYYVCNTVNGPGARGERRGRSSCRRSGVPRGWAELLSYGGSPGYTLIATRLLLIWYRQWIVQIATPPAVRRRRSVRGGGAVVSEVQFIPQVTRNVDWRSARRGRSSNRLCPRGTGELRSFAILGHCCDLSPSTNPCRSVVVRLQQGSGVALLCFCPRRR